MWPTNEKDKWEAEGQVDSQLSMIDTHGNPCEDIDDFEEEESIRRNFRPDFKVYVQEHGITTWNNDIAD